MCWRLCCPKKRNGGHDSEQALLHEHETYQGSGKHLTTGGTRDRAPKISNDSEDPQNNQDSYDCPTDNEDDPQIQTSVKEFLRKYEHNATLRDLYEEQFTKLLGRRRFRRTMVYLGNRKDLSDYKDHIELRIKSMVKDVDPKPDKDKIDSVVKAMVNLILDTEIRKTIIMSVNNHMSAE